jgi:lipid-binding SYLF domain-containing protein
MTTRRRFIEASAAAAGLALLQGCVSTPTAAPAADKRAEIRKMRADTLAQLYQAHPPAKARVQQAAGYAVFSNIGVNLILLSAAGGSGLAHDNRSGRDTYMKMISGGLGLGLGVKDFRGVFVFATPQALATFVDSGWEANVQADAAAVAEGRGGAVSGAVTVAPGVDLYQLTKNGLALQATVQGTKYYRDEELSPAEKARK